MLINIVRKRRTFKNYSNDVKLIHSNVSSQMLLIHSNVSKFFIKQHSLGGNSNSMDGEGFLKKIEVTRFIGKLFPLTTIEEQSEE